MVKKKWLRVLIIGIIIIGTGLCFWQISSAYQREYNKYEHRGVPIFEIGLNGVGIEEINEGSKDTKYENNKIKIYHDGIIDGYGNVEVKGRGNGTWVQEKKPYQIKFDKKVDLFGMGKAKKWVLLANAMDVSNIRTEISFYLEGMLGMGYGLGGKFIELYIDGVYYGLYYLTHALEINKNVVDLRDPLGVLVELDNYYGWMESVYETGNGDKLVIKDLAAKDMRDIAMERFLEDYNEFEIAVENRDYERIIELVDVRSFAQYYLLNEFTVNPDAYWTSFYMYKDGDNDKIHAGPGWDFDLALSNRAWGNWLGEDFYSPKKTMIRKQEIMGEEEYRSMGLIEEGGMDWYVSSLNLSQIIFNLMELPEFQEEVRRIYVERMKGREDELIWQIGRWMDEIEEAAIANELKWVEDSFKQEVEMIKKWIIERYEYFDIVYGGDSINLDV